VSFQTSIFKWTSIVTEWAGVMFLASEFLETEAHCRRLLTWIWVLVCVVGLLGLLEAATGFNLNKVLTTGYVPDELFYDPLTRGGVVRIRSTFAHPIELGGFLSFVMPVLLMLLLAEGRRSDKVLYMATSTLSLAGLALSLSLGPIVAALTGFAFVYLLGRRRTLLTALTAIAAFLVIFLAVGPASQPIQSLALERLDFSTYSGGNVASRVAIVLAALDAFARAPVLGSGIGTWFVVNPYAVFAGWSNSAGGSGNENFFAQVLVETGLLGLGASLFLLYSVLRTIWSAARPSPAMRQPLVGLFAGVLAFCVLNLTANVFSSVQANSMLWIIVAAFLRLAALRSGEQRSPAPTTSSEVEAIRAA
jgi:O-antigen ligase